MKIINIILFFSLTFLSGNNLRLNNKDLLLNKDKYIIIDARAKKLYAKGHIKDAINFPSNLTYERKANNGKIVNPKKMQEIVRNLGLNSNSDIVIYDNGSFFDAARLFWALEVYGFTKIKLLNTGYNSWVKNKYNISKKSPKIIKSSYISKINHKRLATRFQTQIATKNPNQTIIDARTYGAYIGNESSAKRFGHIPEAIHISAHNNINNSENISRLETTDKLKEVYKNIDKNKKIIIYCAIGKVAAANYFALRELGYNVSNYDASWKEWGNDFSLPIIKEKN